jgi:Spy/CpxP family protein refolding chaperone
MKRYSVLLLTAVLVLVGTPAQAQQRSPGPEGQAGGQSVLDILKLLQEQFNSDLVNQIQRGGGGRGPVDSDHEAKLRELERFINRAGGPVVVNAVTGAWWTNPALVSRLALTEGQKEKILKSFENHRLSLESSKLLLEKEEAQLARLLGTETVDHNAAVAQIYRVVNARGEMERTNATMTLEMREHLTLAQWTQLQAQSNATLRFVPAGARGEPTPTAAPTPVPAQRGGGAGARGTPRQ